jgi:hypothetical protein
MGGGRIFLKTFHASLFYEDLSNEPNFGLIHFAKHAVPIKKRKTAIKMPLKEL